MYRILLHEAVAPDDLPKLSADVAKKIRATIRQRLTGYPDLYGKPLRGVLKGYWKLRVGDYRVIYMIRGRTVKILMIEHRSTVYREILKRLST